MLADRSAQRSGQPVVDLCRQHGQVGERDGRDEMGGQGDAEQRELRRLPREPDAVGRRVSASRWPQALGQVTTWAAARAVDCRRITD